MNDKITKLAFTITVMVAMMAFGLSFVAIQEMAIRTGATTWWGSYVLPFLIDGVIVVFQVVALAKSMSGKGANVEMFFVFCASCVSGYLNFVHVGNSLNARIIALVPPIVLFFAFERVMDMIKSKVEESGAILSLEQIKQKHNEIVQAVKSAQEKVSALEADTKRLTGERNQLTACVNRLTSERQALESEVSALKKRIDEMGQAKFTDEQLVALYTVAPQLTQQVAADIMGVSRTAISEREKTMSGVIHRNGSVKVL